MQDPQNIVGTQIKSIRTCRKMTQAMLAARCGALGWDVSENVITKIEKGFRCVTDKEVKILAKALKVPVQDLF